MLDRRYLCFVCAWGHLSFNQSHRLYPIVLRPSGSVGRHSTQSRGIRKLNIWADISLETKTKFVKISKFIKKKSFACSCIFSVCVLWLFRCRKQVLPPVLSIIISGDWRRRPSVLCLVMFVLFVLTLCAFLLKKHRILIFADFL